MYRNVRIRLISEMDNIHLIPLTSSKKAVPLVDVGVIIFILIVQLLVTGALQAFVMWTILDFLLRYVKICKEKI